ncbi:carbonic anhydrase [Sabulicella rubraurantiaca]|uniref:carbonic anhydrase n=1 Tax=Sabulicella rubraurantiaca TaxID=2811429 RepID=UPI001A95FB99|nr:carbonic anhydrase [Sabulicella rubraurantiaca]
MKRLLAGYRKFRTEIWASERDRYEALSREGQQPETMVIACSDSRVDPATVFGAGPGELFTVRNIAGLVPPFSPDGGLHGTSAALEYGVRVLKVARIVVLGHAQCGGVRAMVQGAPRDAQDFVAPWMALATPVLTCAPAELTGDDLLHHCEIGVVRLSLANLMTFPWIASAVAEGKLALLGFQFSIYTGMLTQIDGDDAANEIL